jgi:hypothetical protein
MIEKMARQRKNKTTTKKTKQIKNTKVLHTTGTLIAKKRTKQKYNK